MTQGEVAEAQKRVREWTPNMQPLTATDAETWSCDTEMNKKPYTQQWTISNGRMTAPHGKGYLRVVKNDDHVLTAFSNLTRNKADDPVLHLIIIDKKTGSYFEIDTVAMSVMGKAYDETPEPNVETGRCTLLRR
jgi:hypothetical protein